MPDLYQYNGMEKQNVLGLEWLDYGARMYQPDLGRFFVEDRFADKYAGQSTYLYAFDNPIKYIDVNGDSAWQITNEWKKEEIANYRKYVQQRTSDARENGEEYTCEDFALGVLIDFASENGLPISIENGQGTFDAHSDEFKSVEEFKDAVFKTTGAKDIQKQSNTQVTEWFKAGDLVVGRDDENLAFHIQVVSQINLKTRKIEIHQGSESVGSADPKSFFYAGKSVSRGVWNLNTDVYRNPPKTISEYSKNYNTEGRRWNFKNFNKTSVSK